jgi:YD repeat-containing protein
MIVRLLVFWALFFVCTSHAAAQSYDYDERGRLHLVTYSDCSTIQYDYDVSGNRTERIVLAGAGDCDGNRPPIAIDDAITLAPGESKLFDLRLAHGGVEADSDPDESDPSILRITDVSQGNVPAISGGEDAIILQSDNQNVRVTATNAAGIYQFTYTLSDPQGLTDEGHVQLTVSSGDGGGDDNTPPRFTSPSFIDPVTEGYQSVLYTAVVTDDDAGDVPVFIELEAAYTDHFSFDVNTGVLSLNAGVAAGAYDVTLKVTDNKSSPVELPLTVTVQAVEPQNQPPTPNTVSKTGLTRTNEMWVAIPLTGIDADNDVVSLVGLTSTSNPSVGAIATSATGSRGGSAEVHGSRSDVVRVWSSAPIGQWEEFLYWVSDGVNPAESALLRVRVDNRPPSVNSNSYTFTTGETRTLTDITANDTDPDGDTPLTIGRVSDFEAGDGFIGGGGGAVNEDDRTQVTYEAPSQVGSARFGAVIQDPTGGYAFQWVYIDVVAPQPVAVDDTFSVSATGSSIPLDVLANDQYPGRESYLTITEVSPNWPDDCDVLDPEPEPGGGIPGEPDLNVCHLYPEVHRSPDGKSVVFNPGQWGLGNVVSFTYTITDQSAQTPSSSATVTITRSTPANSAPVWVSGTAANQSENQTVTGYYARASDGNDDPITYAIAPGGDGSQFSINADTGALSFGSAPDFEHPGDADEDNEYVVNLTASDGSVSVEHQVTISVTNQNEAPVWDSGTSKTVSENSTSTGYDARATDPEGQTPTYSISGGADASLFTINASSGSLRFNDAPDFEAPTDSGGNNVYDVTLSASDGAFSPTHSVAIRVIDVSEQAPNRAPTPVDDWPFAISGIARSINVLGNDTDPDGDTPLYLHSVTDGSAGGTARIVSGQIEITPGAARNETFTYTVRDRASGGLQGTATIHATVNRHPNLQSETYTLSPGETRTLNVLSNDSDPDTPFGGQPIEIYAVTHVNGGATASYGGGQSISYTAPNVAGSYHFNYWVRDNAGGVSNVRSYVTVVAPNQFPTTSPDYFMLQPGETRVLYGILSNDSDPDGDPLTIERVYEFQGGGSGSVNADRTSVTYTAPLTTGSARFAYVAIDGRGGYKFNWVNITVLPPIDPCGGGILCP